MLQYNAVLCGETCPVTVKVLPRTGPVEFYLIPAIDLLDCPDYRRVCFSFASGFKDIWFFRTRREQQHPMVSDKGGWYYWKCGGRASLNYLLERDMLRHRFPFPVGEDTPQTPLSHPYGGPS